jgi:hypothetical protein
MLVSSIPSVCLPSEREHALLPDHQFIADTEIDVLVSDLASAGHPHQLYYSYIVCDKSNICMHLYLSSIYLVCSRMHKRPCVYAFACMCVRDGMCA